MTANQKMAKKPEVIHLEVSVITPSPKGEGF